MSVDLKSTVYLPKTDFPMKAGLNALEPKLLARWEKIDLYKRLREQSKGREKFVLHDGPPYANGNLHIGHALNKILKDVINRTQQMMGKDANYVPGWDCHGLPIEWKIEEQYREKGADKDSVPIVEFRRECREFAQKWVDVQREEFKRMGVIGDWNNPYTTMSFASEAQITREILKFLDNGLLYLGSKPVMWSVVERTALAEAEVEYDDHVSDTIWVKFPVRNFTAKADSGDPDALARGEAEFLKEWDQLLNSNVVIWTTTPWTIPGNRAISFSSRIEYSIYEVISAPDDNWVKANEKLVLADALADAVMKQARVTEFKKLSKISSETLARLICAHPLKGVGGGYEFHVPLLDGDHVTADTGTGFVHTAPSHGREDFEIWMSSSAMLIARGIETRIPYTVDEAGAFTNEAPGFTGKRVITDDGKKGEANEAVIAALRETNAIIARSRLTHQYPHSWRSKKPLIFRNTPQWFIAMDKPFGATNESLRTVALRSVDGTAFYPKTGYNRLHGMIEGRPDWVVSRQRAWGVPIAVFVKKDDGSLLRDRGVNERIVKAIEAEGADAWFASDPERFLGNTYNSADYTQVTDILDVWFDSGATHSFVLEQRPDLKWPASLYLEGSDQHRGWFHSSLLESCGTRGRAPYDGVLTHGFVMAEDGQKMSKSLGNVVAPQEVIAQSGADILRLWVVGSDYSEDLRIGPEILKYHADIYRRIRNTLRYLLGNLDGFDDRERVRVADMPELERWVLHRLSEIDRSLRDACARLEYHHIFTELHNFCAVDLSAFYLDIRKDSLYCDRADDPRRRATRTVLDALFNCLTAWVAPFCCFTAEEAWLARHPSETDSVHLRTFPDIPADWRDDALAAKWQRVRDLRRVVTGAIELERAEKRIRSSLEAAPVVYMSPDYNDVLKGLDLAEIAITSDASLSTAVAPANAFTLADVAGVAVVPKLADGAKCVRCYRVLPEVSRDPARGEVCDRCADAVAHFPAAAE